MERSIDHHDSQRPARAASGRIHKWREAWTACHSIIEGFPSSNLKTFHLIFGQWVSILNWIFGNPIAKLKLYTPLFYYCNEPNGPQEILTLFMDPEVGDNSERYMHIVFNLYEFNKIRREICDNMNRHNHMLVDEARGTINFSIMEDTLHNPAEYFQCHHLAITVPLDLTFDGTLGYIRQVSTRQLRYTHATSRIRFLHNLLLRTIGVLSSVIK
ncbi:hypothetical protein JTE90_016333 [Oedothorax gibbosus]|uniref:Uncharacterized protein n=1 Tax=Oedothorax gibbosus TaxID=931172 RepID=A0AAV6TQL7_9ARAC|nr:hypothetical protein JTE90_016333 [Oedothorax gibbosus]